MKHIPVYKSFDIMPSFETDSLHHIIFRAAMTEAFLPPAYIYLNTFILAFGVWSIISTESAESIFMVRFKYVYNYFPFVINRIISFILTLS